MAAGVSDSSMLFYTKNDYTPVYILDTNGKLISSYEAPSNVFFRITKIYKVNDNGTLTRISESDNVPDSQKVLYTDTSYYIYKNDLEYVQNFQGDYASAEIVDINIILTKPAILLYGPHPRSTEKTTITKLPCPVKVTRMKNGYYFIRASQTVPSGKDWSGWVHKDNITYIYGSKDDIEKYSDGRVVRYGDAISDPGQIFAPSSSVIHSVLNSNGIYNRNDINQRYTHFNRFGYLDPYNALTGTREYLFFTKPDLHIFKDKTPASLNPQLDNISIFKDALFRYKPVLLQLQGSAKGNSSPFMNILSNTVSSSLDLPTISANDVDTASNIYGTYLSYRTTSINSDEAFEFSLDFKDTKFLEVYMLFKLYDEYERRKFFGEITPPDRLYIFRKRLHDQISIYKFIVDEDGKSLIYWAKLTGCYPKGVPRDVFSNISESRDGLTINIPWRAQFVEDMNPMILSDFNRLVQPKKTDTKLDLYDQNISGPNGTWANAPYIEKINTQNVSNVPMEMQNKYVLVWRK